MPVQARIREEKVLLLPSQYNPVWENIRMDKLEAAFFGAQPLESADYESLKQIFGKITLGLKRCWNMYDMYNRGNLTILSSLAANGESQPIP